MMTITNSKPNRCSRIAALILILSVCPGIAEKMARLDGIYTESKTWINQDGKEATFFPSDHAVLELQQDHFKFWHFSDSIGSRHFPIEGEFSRDGENIELESQELTPSEKHYVATTIKGVTGIWPAKDLKAWRNGEFPVTAPILIRVADGTAGKELDQSKFKFPSVTPLLDKKAAEKYWLEEQKKHDERYQDVPEPLRSLLRENSNRDDHDRAGYRKLILAQQQKPDPKLIKQLLSETGKGVSVVVGPMVLKDIFGCGAQFSEPAVFAKKNATKRVALEALANAMPETNNSNALNAALLVFIRTTGLDEIDLTCADDTQVKLSWKENRRTIKSYDFNETVSTGCEAWAIQQLEELYGAGDLSDH